THYSCYCFHTPVSLYSCLSVFSSIMPLPPRSTLFPYTTLFRSRRRCGRARRGRSRRRAGAPAAHPPPPDTPARVGTARAGVSGKSEEHTSELQSRENLVCRLLLEKKKTQKHHHTTRAGKLSTQR